jgi:hypothetical protein
MCASRHRGGSPPRAAGSRTNTVCRGIGCRHEVSVRSVRGSAGREKRSPGRNGTHRTAPGSRTNRTVAG